MHWIANPRRPVRLRLAPPIHLRIGRVRRTRKNFEKGTNPCFKITLECPGGAKRRKARVSRKAGADSDELVEFEELVKTSRRVPIPALKIPLECPGGAKRRKARVSRKAGADSDELVEFEELVKTSRRVPIPALK